MNASGSVMIRKYKIVNLLNLSIIHIQMRQMVFILFFFL